MIRYKNMMNGLKYFALAAVVASVPAETASAETVSRRQAADLAQKFFDQAYHELTAPVVLASDGKRMTFGKGLTTDRLFTPFYIFNQPRGGFVIISAENKAFPILGFSLKSKFDPDSLTEQERGWLKGFAKDIELIRYDPRVPEEAVSAWQNYPQYVVDILNARLTATDASITSADAEKALEPLLYSAGDDSTDAYFSAIYTPEQWKDMIADQIDSDSEVCLGYVDDSKVLYPAVAHGRKGDYFRLQFDRPNDWLLRLMPAEFMGERQIASLSKPTYTPDPEPEETPFEFYDSFIAEQNESARVREEALSALPAEPVITTTGAGHFDILLPENARLAMIYNLNGAHVGRFTYSGQPMAHINIEREPAGFYFALIYGESGKPYGIKLYR